MRNGEVYGWIAAWMHERKERCGRKIGRDNEGEGKQRRNKQRNKE
jgi:hypothetical protein